MKHPHTEMEWSSGLGGTICQRDGGVACPPAWRKLSNLNNCQLNFVLVPPTASAACGGWYKCQDTFDAVVEFSIGSHLPHHLEAPITRTKAAGLLGFTDASLICIKRCTSCRSSTPFSGQWHTGNQLLHELAFTMPKGVRRTHHRTLIKFYNFNAQFPR